MAALCCGSYDVHAGSQCELLLVACLNNSSWVIECVVCAAALMLDCRNACVVCCLQADATQKPTLRSYRQAACLVAAQALVPSAAAAAAGVPTQVVLSVHQPRVIIVRRFMNNVLYVMAMMSHELDAAGSAQQGQQQPKPQPQPQPAPQKQSHAAATPAAVFLFTLNGVQVGALRVHRWGWCLRRLGCVVQFLFTTVWE